MQAPNDLRYKRNSKGYIYALYSASDGVAEVSIGKAISKADWDKKNYDKATKNIMGRLNLLVDKFVQPKHNALEPVLKEEIETLLKVDLGRTEKIVTKTLHSELVKYKEMILAGDIDYNGKPYSPSKVRHISAIATLLSDNKLGTIKLAAFNETHYQQFKKLLISKVKAQNTMNAYTTALLKFFKDARRMKWHKGTWHLEEGLRVPRERVEGHVHHPPKELETLLKLTCKNLWQEKTRDLYVFGCCVGLRDIDIQHLDRAVVKDGVLIKYTQKRGHVVHIPLNKIARDIWEKYEGKLPTRTNAAFNTGIEAICQDAKFNDLCLHVRTVGGKPVETILPKWKLCGTHTMRRTFATNAIKAGVPPYAVMKMGGWKNEEDMFNYLKLSVEENAELLKGHEHFK